MALKKQIKSQENTISSYDAVKKMANDKRDGCGALEALKKETQLLHAKLVELKQAQKNSK